MLSLRARNVGPRDKSKVLNLLALEYSETQAPAGIVTLSFSGGVALRLEVECVESEVVDLGPVWAASCCPNHDADDEQGDAELQVRGGRGDQHE